MRQVASSDTLSFDYIFTYWTVYMQLWTMVPTKFYYSHYSSWFTNLLKELKELKVPRFESGSSLCQFCKFPWSSQCAILLIYYGPPLSPLLPRGVFDLDRCLYCLCLPAYLDTISVFIERHMGFSFYFRSRILTSLFRSTDKFSLV